MIEAATTSLTPPPVPPRKLPVRTPLCSPRPTPVPSCYPIAYSLLVVGPALGPLRFTPVLLAGCAALGIRCVITLLSEKEFNSISTAELFGQAPGEEGDGALPSVELLYCFWPSEAGAVPERRQLRRILGIMDRAWRDRVATPRRPFVLVHGAGDAQRAAW